MFTAFHTQGHGPLSTYLNAALEGSSTPVHRLLGCGSRVIMASPGPRAPNPNQMLLILKWPAP
jgi:hypothetical protein